MAGPSPVQSPGAEVFLVPINQTMPSTVVESPDGAVMGPFVRDPAANTSIGTSVTPAGKGPDYLETTSLFASTAAKTVRLKAFDLARVQPSNREVRDRLYKSGLVGADRAAARQALFRQYDSVARLGVNLRSADDSSGDTLDTWRKVTRDFALWTDPATTDTWIDIGSGNTLCGSPRLVEGADGALYMLVLYWDGTNNVLQLYRYATHMAAGLTTFPDPYPWWTPIYADTTDALTGSGALSGIVPSQYAQLSACLWKKKIHFAVGTAAGTFPSMTSCKIRVGRVGSSSTGTGVFEAVSLLDLRAQLGSAVSLMDGTKACGLCLRGSETSLNLAVGICSRGKFSDASTNHLNVLTARSPDGVNWGFRGVDGAPGQKFNALNDIEAVADIPNVVASESPPVTATVLFTANDGWSVAETGELFRTTTCGRWWFPVWAVADLLRTDTGQPLALYGVHCRADGHVIVAVGAQGTIVYSPDGGTTWHLVRTNNAYLQRQTSLYDPPRSGGLTGVGTLRDVVVWGDTDWAVVGDNGQIWYTGDAGVTWSSKRSGTAANTHYYAIAIKDGVTRGVVVVGAPDAKTGGARVISTDDIAVATPSWTNRDLSAPGGETLYGLTKIGGGGSNHGTYGWATGRGMVVGAQGLMMALDASNAATVLTDGDGNRWTTADLRAVAWIDAATRFVVGDGGDVLRTIDYPSTPSAGVPSFAEQLIVDPQGLRAAAAASVTAATFGGVEGWAVITAAFSNRTYPELIYLDDLREWVLSCSNTSQGEVELYRSQDDGEHYQLQPSRGLGAVIRFATSGNAIAADGNTTGTPCTSLFETVEGDLVMSTGRSPSSGQWGIVSQDGGHFWVTRLDQTLASPFGGMPTSSAAAPSGQFWLWNSTRTAVAYANMRLFSAVYDDSRRYVGTFVARRWSMSGTYYPPIVPGVDLWVDDDTTLTDFRANFAGKPNPGDKWTSRPGYEYGAQQLLIESPSAYWRNSVWGSAGTTDAEFVWDRQNPDIVAALQSSEKHWDIDSLVIVDSNFPYGFFDLTVPGYDVDGPFPTGTSDFVRFLMSAAHSTWNVVRQVADGVLELNDIATGASPTFVDGDFAPGLRQWYVLLYPPSGSTAPRAYPIRGNTRTIIMGPFPHGPSSGVDFTGWRAQIYGDRMVCLGTSPVLADGTPTGAADLRTSDYRFPRMWRLVVPHPGASSTPIKQKFPSGGPGVMGVAVPCNQTPIVAPVGSVASDGHLAFGRGFGWETVTNTVQDRTPSGVGSVAHFGRVGQVLDLTYPAIYWSQRDELVNLVTRDQLTLRAIALVLDSQNPAKTLYWGRLVKDPRSQQIKGKRFSLGVQFQEER